MPFRPNLRLLNTDILRIRYQYKQIQKKIPFNIFFVVIILIICKNMFWYLLVLYNNSSVTRLKIAPKWSFSYFQPILAAIFVTIATVKVKSIPDFYTLAIILINY